MRKETNIKKKRKFTLYAMALISVTFLLFIGILYYNLNKPSSYKIDTSKFAKTNNETIETEIINNTTKQASMQIGNSVEESEKEQFNTTTNENTNDNDQKIAINTSAVNSKTEEIPTQSKVEDNVEKENEEEEKEELSFSMPVDGEIVKEFAKDTLLYSATLNEWTTHLGIDIKAEKTTVVKASEKGTVKYIKNDPRYGLTVLIEHSDGYCTVYSNLLTSEFVVEGEQVEKGQTIGTVGNTAVFEIADESHLHFEILKDNVQVDPNIYLK